MLTCLNCGRASPDDFAFCPACSAPLAVSTPAPDVRKTVTIVFCDVTGSTALGERLDPESLRDVQTRYFDAMSAAIERHGGTVEKYIGDAVMSVFGIPYLHEDDALRASRAVVDMRDGLAALNKELERDRGVSLQVRIGVNTGAVVAGDTTTGSALVTGDAVHVAARLEQHAAPGEILLGEATYRLVGDHVDADPVAPIDAKGKSDRVPAWRLLRVRGVDAWTPRHVDAPMVGRERQLAQLQRSFQAAVEDSSCQLFTLLGAAGVGKSRLVEEFVSGLDEGAMLLRGRCLPYGEGITYFPVIEAIKQASGLADFDLPGVVEAKVCSVLAGEEHQDQICRHVTQIMGVADGRGGEETFWAIRRFFEASARERPLVLAFDDIHWGEPTFLDLVDHVADWSRGSPILLLCMARPDLLDVRPAWGGGKFNAATVSLEPLGGEQARALIGHLAGSDLPPGVTERIARTSEGNPLFVEEILGMMIDEGLITHEGDQWVAAGNVDMLSVPPSIQALLAARVDRLTPPERTVLEAAAVVGQGFFLGAVVELVPGRAPEQTRSDLLGLVRKELIRSERSTLAGEDAFRFRHLLIRDSAYEAIPKARRAELHEHLADWLERIAGQAVGEQEEIVGYHLEQAYRCRTELGPLDDRSDAIGRRAAARFASAGRRATDRSDFTAAVNLLRRSLEIGPPDGADRPATLYHLGIALGEIDDFPGLFAAFDQVIQLTTASDDRSLQWLARINRTDIELWLDPFSKAQDERRDELDEAIRVFEELRDEAGLATAWRKVTFLEFESCRFDAATRNARRAVRHARRSDDEHLLAEALLEQIAAQSFGSATPAEGLAALDELSEDIARFRKLEATALALRGVYLGLQGHPEQARSLIVRSIESAETLGVLISVALHEQLLGDAEMEAGDTLAAESAYRRSYEIADQIGWEGFKTTPAGLLARTLCELGRIDEAERYATIARDAAAAHDLGPQVLGRSVQALVLAARGRFDEAEDLGREAIRLFADAEDPNNQGRIRMDLARVLLAAGKTANAEGAAREALSLFERKGNRPSAHATRAFIEELSRSG